ncbi:MAG: hypothetical protein CM1200mP30_05610 [Pseudomonadota bacterium]|nr:MAG: hypothetical protein CM1200mP30_05610 [Pseudomonadota bacterium]
MWKNHDLEKSYDVVIFGQVHTVGNSVLFDQTWLYKYSRSEQKFIGYGGSGRNPAIFRSNYRTRRE